jgi:hypothetical protein
MHQLILHCKIGQSTIVLFGKRFVLLHVSCHMWILRFEESNSWQLGVLHFKIVNISWLLFVLIWLWVFLGFNKPKNTHSHINNQEANKPKNTHSHINNQEAKKPKNTHSHINNQEANKPKNTHSHIKTNNSQEIVSRVHPFGNYQNRVRTHAILVIGLYEL